MRMAAPPRSSSGGRQCSVWMWVPDCPQAPHACTTEGRSPAGMPYFVRLVHTSRLTICGVWMRVGAGNV